MKLTDFENIFLTKSDLNILIDASDGKILNAHPVSVQFLMDYGLLSKYPLSDNENQFVISSVGIRYLEYLDQTQHSHKDGTSKGNQNKNQLFYNICKVVAVLASLATIAVALKSFNIF